MAGNTASPGFMHDKLRDQISESIKESLTKATTVLSGLHRVQSYLDVLKSVEVVEGRVNEVVEQVRRIRSDTAALLQTIYITEIGLESFEQVHLSSDSATTLSQIQRELTPSHPAPAQSHLTPPPHPHPPAPAIADQHSTTPITLQTIILNSEEEPHPPAAKKPNYGNLMRKCAVCNTTTDPNSLFDDDLCKMCHSKNTLLTEAHSHSHSQSTASSSVHRKPKKPSTVSVSCKMCGASFVYRRCLLRHLKENHPNVDQNNINSYIINENSSTAVPQEVSLSVSEIQLATQSQDQEGEDEAQGKKSTNEEANPTTKQLYTCSICNKIFDRPYRLMRHLNIHDPNRPRVTCHVCDRSFTRLDTLVNHVKSVHSNERPFSCQYTNCEKTFATQTALMCHLKTHTNGKPYQCRECDAAFSLQLEYKIHIRQAHPETEKLRCNDCYQVFSDATSLEEHRSAEHLFECEVCGKKFARLAYLQLHAKIHRGDSFFNCSVCSEGFSLESAYRQHMKSHPKIDRGKKFHCQLCDVNFDVPADLIAHYSSEEHRQKSNTLGLDSSTTILNTISSDLSDLSEMAAIVDNVAMETSTTDLPLNPEPSDMLHPLSS